jgi:hypothetical protein
MEEYAARPVPQRLARLERTADELAGALRGQSEAVVSRRPDAKSWAAKEVVCHLRDTEEMFIARFQLVLAMDDPKFVPMSPDTPDRWAQDRQYLRNDAGEALAAFGRRRGDTLGLLKGLTAEQWERGGLHHTRGRMTIGDWLTLMAWHDDNHLDQLKRALDGKP